MTKKSIAKSFKYAIRGLKTALDEERNLKIHVICSFIAILLGIFLKIKPWEMIVILLLIGAVLVLEIVNTVVERLTDMLKPRLHSYVESIKDMMASTVLVASICSVIIGVMIFFPYLATYLK